jgi:fucose 4-O-acetylase-like acetyltransferase
VTSSAGRVRDQTIDAAKGVAIIAIVLGHVNRGLAGADIVDPRGSWFVHSDHVLYLWHLAIFALLSGIFVEAGVRRHGAGSYARQRLGTFLYLYLVWSLLQGAVRVAAADSANSHTTIGDIVKLWVPDGQLWFFGWLCVMTVLVLLVRPWEPPPRRWTGVATGLGISLAAWGWYSPYFGLGGLGLTAFFVAGCAVGPRPLSRVGAAHVITLCVVAAAFGASFVALLLVPTAAPTVGSADRSAATLLAGIAASLAGTVAVLAASALLARLAVSRTLAYLGRHSLEIFLAHITAAAGTRIILVRLGVGDPVIHLVAGTITGLVGPLVLLVVCQRLGFRFLFSAPSILTGRPPMAPQSSPSAT